MRDQSQGLAKFGAIFLGFGLAALLVVANGFAAFNFLPSSYERFTWEAYAFVVYTHTPTATPTLTATPTPTPSGNEVGTCDDEFDNDFDGAVDCADADCLGDPVCRVPVPAVSNRTLPLIVGLLVMIGFFALAPLRFRKDG